MVSDGIWRPADVLPVQGNQLHCGADDHFAAKPRQVVFERWQAAESWLDQRRRRRLAEMPEFACQILWKLLPADIVTGSTYGGETGQGEIVKRRHPVCRDCQNRADGQEGDNDKAIEIVLRTTHGACVAGGEGRLQGARCHGSRERPVWLAAVQNSGDRMRAKFRPGAIGLPIWPTARPAASPQVPLVVIRGTTDFERCVAFGRAPEEFVAHE